MLEKIKQIVKVLHPRYTTIFVDYAEQLGPRYGVTRPPHAKLYEILLSQQESINQHIEVAKQYTQWLNGLSEHQTNSHEPYLKNGYMPALDLLMLYALLIQEQPQHYIEVGCGTSTRVAFSAKKQHQINTKIIAVDPTPRLPVLNLVDQHICATMQSLDIQWWKQWSDRDLLFIDNSHRSLPGSDVTTFFLEVLPELPKGMLLHIHDIYWPYDYPTNMCERGYNEQYLLAQAILLQPERYEIIAANHWFTTDVVWKQTREALWASTTNEKLEKTGCSFWCRIK